MVNPAHAQKAKRVALLIGNASYSVGRLSNPPGDVREMESALKAVGFHVQTVLNANQNAMKRAVRDFGNLAQGADIAFLYYSGHGTQVNGENYLIPVQANIDKEADYEVEAVSANAVMRQLAGARPKAAIVVLDACRDNPLTASTKSASKGLSRMDAPTGTMIAFATSPNTTATDEGVYARALARQIRTPGLEIMDVFRNTTAEVRKATGGKQEPRISEMSITERIYLMDAVAQRAPAARPSVSIDYAEGPLVRFSDGTTRINAENSNLVVKVCREGMSYTHGKCLGEPKLFTLEEAHQAAQQANQQGHAGATNWFVPRHTELLAFISVVRHEMVPNGKRLTAIEELDLIHRVFPDVKREDDFYSWMLPRHQNDEYWGKYGRNDLGGGRVIYKNGRHHLRLVRFLQ